jgi:hypothetical protein
LLEAIIKIKNIFKDINNEQENVSTIEKKKKK